MNRFYGNIYFTNLQSLLINSTEKKVVIIGEREIDQNSAFKNMSVSYAFDYQGGFYEKPKDLPRLHNTLKQLP
jgi:hypothetical protein